MRHALTVDVEEYFQVSNFESVLPRDGWDGLPSRVEDATRRLLDLFDARGQRATFFVLGWVARRHPGLLREIDDRGHELASHGDGHARLFALGPERFRQDLRRSRRALEDAVGRAPRGYRAPSFSITPATRWALGILAEEGFRYDSSIFPIRHPRYGWPGFPPHPVRLELGDGQLLDEYPPSTAPLGRWRLPVAGGAYLRLLPGPLFRMGFRRAVAGPRPGLLYVHPWEIDPDQPRQAVGWRTRINHYHGLDRTWERLDALLAGHGFAPVSEVLEALRMSDGLPQQAPPAIPAPAPGRAWAQPAVLPR